MSIRQTVEPKFTSALKSSKPSKKKTCSPTGPNKICYLTKRKLPIPKQRNYLTTSKKITTENRAINQFIEKQNLIYQKRGFGSLTNFFSQNLPKLAKLTDGYTNNNPFSL